jgi:hypothetical protein
MKTGWVWKLPEQKAAGAIVESAKRLKNPEDAQQKEVSTFEKNEHVQGNPGEVEVDI